MIIGLTQIQNAILSILKKNGSIKHSNLYLHFEIPESILYKQLKVLRKKGLVVSSGKSKAMVWRCC